MVNWPAGGGIDRIGRLVAEHARRKLDVPMAVIYVSGAGGATGVRHVADSDPEMEYEETLAKARGFEKALSFITEGNRFEISVTSVPLW